MTLNIDVLRSSFELAKPIAGDVMNYFYDTLWSRYPASKALFEKTEMSAQKSALTKSLVFIVDNLDNPDRLTAFLKGMGARHNQYGVRDEHYDWVGDALLSTFSFFFKEKWTRELNEEWTKAYGVIASTMKLGAEAQRSVSTAGMKTAPISNEAATGVDVVLPNAIKAKIREQVRQQVTALIQAEIQRSCDEILRELNTAGIDSFVKSRKAA